MDAITVIERRRSKCRKQRLERQRTRRQMLVDAIAELDCESLHKLVCRRGATNTDVQLALGQTERTAAEVLDPYNAWVAGQPITTAAANKVRIRLVQEWLFPPSPGGEAESEPLTDE